MTGYPLVVRHLVLPLRELVAEDGAEFAAALARCMRESGLSAAELGRRATISRTQVYELTGKPSIPRDRAQVARFLRTCGLHPAQIGVMLLQWEALRVA